MSRPRFRLIETTADAGLIIWGRDFPELLENAACGLTRVIGGRSALLGRQAVRRFVRSKGDGREGLLVAWLSDWLFLFETTGFLGVNFTIGRVGTEGVFGYGWGPDVDARGRPTLTEVKGVTYHALNVDETVTGLRTRVVLDL